MLTHYGLSQEQACTEASRFESLVSRDAIDRMSHAMGHPRKGVCGRSHIVRTAPSVSTQMPEPAYGISGADEEILA